MSSPTTISGWGAASDLATYVRSVPRTEEGGKKVAEQIESKAKGMDDIGKLAYYEAVCDVVNPIFSEYVDAMDGLSGRELESMDQYTDQVSLIPKVRDNLRARVAAANAVTVGTLAKQVMTLQSELDKTRDEVGQLQRQVKQLFELLGKKS